MSYGRHLYTHWSAMSLARPCTAAFAAAAIGWTISIMPMFWSEANVAQAAAHIIAGEVYKPEIMGALEANVKYNLGSAFRSSTLSRAAIIRLRGAEDAIVAGDQKIIDQSLNALSQTVDDALTNAPSDPYQWLVLFWLNNTRNGIRPEHLRYLKMSYALGPYEGWISIKRNRLALAIYPVLTSELKESAISEFVGLTRSGLYAEAANIVIGLSSPIRKILVGRLRDLPEVDRRSFAKMLYDKGLDDIAVPGIAPQSPRPWN